MDSKDMLVRSEWEKDLRENKTVESVSGYYKGAYIESDYDRDTWQHTVDAFLDGKGYYNGGKQHCYSGAWINAWESLVPQVLEAMDAVDAALIRMETPVISSFSDMTVDMHYFFWLPAVRAVCGNKAIVMDCDGRIRNDQGTVLYSEYPVKKEKIEQLREWVLLHREEIIENHMICSRGDNNVKPIAPPEMPEEH